MFFSPFDFPIIINGGIQAAEGRGTGYLALDVGDWFCGSLKVLL